MKSEDEVHEELKRLAPDFPEKHTVQPPEGYFDVLPDTILSKWKKQVPVRSLTPWRRIAGIAALLTGLLIGAFWLISSEEQLQSQEITALEAYQYIHEHIHEFEGMID